MNIIFRRTVENCQMIVDLSDWSEDEQTEFQVHKGNFSKKKGIKDKQLFQKGMTNANNLEVHPDQVHQQIEEEDYQDQMAQIAVLVLCSDGPYSSTQFNEYLTLNGINLDLPKKQLMKFTRAFFLKISRMVLLPLQNHLKQNYSQSFEQITGKVRKFIMFYLFTRKNILNSIQRQTLVAYVKHIFQIDTNNEFKSYNLLKVYNKLTKYAHQYYANCVEDKKQKQKQIIGFTSSKKLVQFWTLEHEQILRTKYKENGSIFDVRRVLGQRFPQQKLLFNRNMVTGRLRDLIFKMINELTLFCSKKENKDIPQLTIYYQAFITSLCLMSAMKKTRKEMCWIPDWIKDRNLKNISKIIKKLNDLERLWREGKLKTKIYQKNDQN